MQNAEIDQSGKVEQSGDTFLALVASDKRSFVVRIPARTKRSVYQLLREHGKPKKRATLLLFSASVYLLLEDHLPSLQQIIIDNEYVGHERDVKASLFRFAEKRQRPFRGNILVKSIGKKSKAHIVVLKAYRGQIKPDKVISEKQLIGLIFK